MNKSDLVAEIAAITRQPATQVSEVIDALMAVVTRTVARGDKVVLSGFGTFLRRSRARRVARDIWADQPVNVPARNVPAFRPGKPFRETVARSRPRRRAATKPTAAGRSATKR